MAHTISPLKKLIRRIKLLRNYFYDFNRYCKYSSAICREGSLNKMEPLIMMRIHSLEKGLSLETPRLGFGIKVLKELLSMLKEYAELGGSEFMIDLGISVLQEYIRYHKDRNYDVSDLEKKVQELAGDIQGFESLKLPSGVRSYTKEELYKKSKIDFEGFCSSRFSVRQFASETVPHEEIMDAIRISQRTPSVCNRQSSRVRVISERESVAGVLEIGGGARGFSEEIQAVLVVTSDLSCFQSNGERYQCWIDGGMFAMTLIYALHSKGIVSCCMNWSKDYHTDLHLRKYLNMNSSENIIVLLGIGYPKDAFTVAQSARKPVSEVAIFH